MRERGVLVYFGEATVVPSDSRNLAVFGSRVANETPREETVAARRSVHCNVTLISNVESKASCNESCLDTCMKAMKWCLVRRENNPAVSEHFMAKTHRD